MFKRIISALVLKSVIAIGTSSAQAQSYYDLAAGIIGQGQAYESQIWEAYNQSLQYEQNLYQSAMNDPRVQMAYRQFLSQGGQASFQDFAVYYVRTAGGNPAAYQRYMNRTAELNAQDRNAVFGTFNYINGVQQQIFNERSESFYRYMYHTGELLNGSATYSDGHYNYTVPTTLSYGQMATDQFGNTFTVDHNNTYYRWTSYGWQALRHGGR